MVQPHGAVKPGVVYRHHLVRSADGNAYSSGFLGDSCEAKAVEVCPDGTLLVNSDLQTDRAFYCMPTKDQQKNQSACAPGTFYDPTSQCCDAFPNSGIEYWVRQSSIHR